MKISAFCLITNPEERQDPFYESLASVQEWANEVVIVNGGKPLPEHITGSTKYRVIEIMKPWEYEWSWEELPIRLNMALEACTGDWALRFDADYIFPRNTGQLIREGLPGINDMRVATVHKFSAILHNKFYTKGGVPLGINKRFDNVKYGRDLSKDTDLCYPIITDGEVDDKGVPLGRLVHAIQTGRVGAKFFNYDYTFKTEEFTRNEFARFSRAYKRYFGYTKWGDNPDASFDKFIEIMKNRMTRGSLTTIPLDKHPEFIREKIKNIKHDQFGYNGWGYLND